MNKQKMQKLSIVMAAALAFLAIGAVENAKARPLPDGPGGGYGSYHHRYYSHYGYHYRTPPLRNYSYHPYQRYRWYR